MRGEAISIQRAWPRKADLVAIETDAAERYRDAGYEPAAWPADSPRDFEEYETAGRLWVAVAAARAVGFAVVDEYGDVDHLEELDVLRAWQGRGIGAALVRASLHAKAAMTLRTFHTTPWSVGLYEKLGFRRWDPELAPQWLAQLALDEIRMGISPADRVSMRHDL